MVFRDRIQEVCFHGLRIWLDSSIWNPRIEGEVFGAFIKHVDSRKGDLELHVRGTSIRVGDTERLKELLRTHIDARVIRVEERRVADRTIVSGIVPRGHGDYNIRLWLVSDGAYSADASMWTTPETAQRGLDDAESLIDSIEFV